MKELFYCVSIRAGSDNYDLSQDLTSLTIEEDEAKADLLTIELKDPFKVFSHAFQEGMVVEVDLGTVDDHSVIFRGRTYKVDADFPEQGVPALRLLAHDQSMKMGLHRRNRAWTDMKLDEIVSQIAAKYFIDQDIRLKGNPQFNGNGIRQQDETDLAFLLRLAAEYSCQMNVDADEMSDVFHFVAQSEIMGAGPEVTLYYGRCGVPNRLIQFKANSDVSNIQLPRVFSGMVFNDGKATGEQAPVAPISNSGDTFLNENLTAFYKQEPDKAAQLEMLIAASGRVQEELRKELGSVERQASPTFITEENLRELVKNQFDTSVQGMRASGATCGNHRIHAQTAIEIADVGGRFSGAWYLSQVRHLLNDQGYQTEFECRR